MYYAVDLGILPVDWGMVLLDAKPRIITHSKQSHLLVNPDSASDSDCITRYNEIAVRDTRASNYSNLVTIYCAPCTSCSFRELFRI